MPNVNTQKIEELIAAEDWEGLKAEVHSFLAGVEVSENDKGIMYFDLLDIYLTVKNELDEEYNQELAEIVASLEAVQKSKGTVDDQADMVQARNILS